MDLKQIEEIIIGCLKANIQNSDEEVPTITGSTAPMSDISGFDSLRTLEVLIELEEILECELPPEKIFDGPKPEDKDIAYIARAVQKVIEGKNNE